MNCALLLAGFAGGVIRGLVGFTKHQYSYKNVGFKWGYFVIMTLISGIIGLAAGWLARGYVASEQLTAEVSAFFTFIAGYAGGDFIENVYKIVAKKPSLYDLPKRS